MGDSVKNLIDSFLNSYSMLSHEETLKELDQLSFLTEASLTPQVESKTEPKTELKAESNPIAKTSSSPKINSLESHSVSARHQGKNIQDSSVLKALLEFHHSRAPVRGAKAPTKTVTPTSASKKPSFTSAEIEIVDAQPKHFSTTKRSNMPTQTILKKK